MSGWTQVNDKNVTVEHFSTSSLIKVSILDYPDGYDQAPVEVEHWFDYDEWDSLCRCVEQINEAPSGPPKDTVPDLSSLDKKNKDEFINGFVELTAKNVLSVFTALGLKTHMDVMVINDVNGEKFRLQFTKIYPPTDES